MSYRKLTIVRIAKDAIWFSLCERLKNVIELGMLGGCLNGIPPSVGAQYSSSQSAGRSKSKLEAVPHKYNAFGSVRQ